MAFLVNRDPDQIGMPKVVGLVLDSSLQHGYLGNVMYIHIYSSYRYISLSPFGRIYIILLKVYIKFVKSVDFTFNREYIYLFNNSICRTKSSHNLLVICNSHNTKLLIHNLIYAQWRIIVYI